MCVYIYIYANVHVIVSDICICSGCVMICCFVPFISILLFWLPEICWGGATICYFVKCSFHFHIAFLMLSGKRVCVCVGLAYVLLLLQSHRPCAKVCVYLWTYIIVADTHIFEHTCTYTCNIRTDTFILIAGIHLHTYTGRRVHHTHTYTHTYTLWSV